MTTHKTVPRERVERFIEELHDAEGDYAIGLAITAMEQYMDAAPDAPAAREDRDKDWILAMGHALGLDSGYMVPVAPTADAFRQLFAAIRSTDGSGIPAADALANNWPASPSTPSPAQARAEPTHCTHTRKYDQRGSECVIRCGLPDGSAAGVPAPDADAALVARLRILRAKRGDKSWAEAADAIERLTRERDKWQTGFAKEEADHAETIRELERAESALAAARADVERMTERITDLDGARRKYGTMMHELFDRAERAESALAAARAENERLRTQYEELIYAVAQKYPGKTRHQTALLYIQERERGVSMQGQSAARAQGDKTP